jgi:hypothetical protein
MWEDPVKMFYSLIMISTAYDVMKIILKQRLQGSISNNYKVLETVNFQDKLKEIAQLG